MRMLFLVLLLPVPVAAQPLNAEAFRQLTEGRTLHFSGNGLPYGAEQFLPGRRSYWRFEGDAECRTGSWEPRGDAICFFYDGAPGPSCWVIARQDGGIVARRQGGPQEAVLTLDRVDDARLPCLHTGPGS